MGNQTRPLSLPEYISKESEQDVIALIESGAPLDKIGPRGTSLYREALAQKLPSLAMVCAGRGAPIVPPLPEGQSVLHFAVVQNDLSLVRAILKNQRIFGNLKNSLDTEGRTPLHYAVLTGNPEAVALMIKFNACKETADSNGDTPKSLAQKVRGANALEIREQFMIEASRNLPYLEDIRIPIISSQDLEILEQLNKGSSCSVYKGRWRGSEVAVKKFKMEYSNSPKEMKKFVKEIQVLSQVRHPNLLLLMGITIDQPQLCIITEFVPNCSLFFAIHKNKSRKLTIDQKHSIALDICRGLAYLHNNQPPIVHRDLKPENCLLDHSLNLKIADFGLARPLSAFSPNESQSQTTICIGTTRFMAPELFDKDKVDSVGTEVDIWALGCVYLELFSGKRPWFHIPSSKTSCILYEIFHQKPLPIPSNVPAMVKKIIESCCQYEPNDRPNINQVLAAMQKSYVN